MAAAEVGDDVYGEDPTVRALEERVAGLLGNEAALFTPTGSMANLLAVRPLVGPGQEVLCEAPAHIARAELGAHAALTGLTMRTWRHPRGRVDLPVDRRRCSRRTWGRTSCRPPRSRWRTPTTSAAERSAARGAAGAARRSPTAQGIGVHLDGARLWNAHVATGMPLAELRRGWPTSCRSACPRASARRSARWSSAAAERDRRGPDLAQAARRRDAAGRRARRGRAVRARPPRRAARRRPRARPAARRGVAASTRRPSTPTSSSSTGADAAAGRRRRPGAGRAGPAVGADPVRLVTHLDVDRRRRRAGREGAGATLNTEQRWPGVTC